MKKLLAGAICCICLQMVIAQKVAFTIGVNGTASFFRGANAASSTDILLSDVPGPATPDVTIFPYGKKLGFGGAASAGIQNINNNGFIAGLSIGYEMLASKVKIMRVEGRFGFTPADGSSKMTHTFINFFPYFGKRFGGKNSSMKCAIDMDLGLDIGIPLSAHEKGKTEISGGSTITTDRDHRKPSADLRPRLQLQLQKNHIGVQSSFSIGLTNYYGYSTLKAYSNVFRLGVFYLL